MSERDGRKVTQRLRDAILRLQYLPGQNLDETELSEKLGVSRTPVREAIIQLIADGLVIREGRKARVAPLELNDIPKLYDALLISSRMIQRLAALNRTDSDLKAIKKSMIRFEKATLAQSGVERSEANQEFHLGISCAAGNRYFQTFYGQVLIDTIRLSRACFSDQLMSRAVPDASLSTHLEETVRQHQLIFEAIEQADAEWADELAVLHHQLTTQRLKKVLFLNGLGGTTTPPLNIDPDLWRLL